MTACELHHLVSGPEAGAAVVLSNSLGTTMRMWEAQVPALGRTHRVVRYDMRGHGGSPVPPSPYTIADLGGDVVALLDRLGIERASLVGVSLGGMVSMWLAANRPERIDRLVLCSTAPYLGPPEVWAERAALVLDEGAEAVADAVVARWFSAEYAAAHPDVVGAVRADLAATPAEGYAACCGALEHMDLRADLARIAAPTLVIVGADDPVTTPALMRPIAAAIPGARFAELRGARHLLNVEQADRATELILEHLDAKGDA